jgi:hypothetical protein
MVRVSFTTDGIRSTIPFSEVREARFAEFMRFAFMRPRCSQTETLPKVVSGDPDPKHVRTSCVERQNLTMRMGGRRFARLTNGFSKKLENHAAMAAVHFMYYNLARIHKTLRITPAMAAGVSDHVWSRKR